MKNQGVISSAVCFLFSQICWGSTPILPNVLLCSVRFPFTFCCFICKRARHRLSGGFFSSFFWIMAASLPSAFPTAVDECEEGRSFDSRDLRRQTYAATTTIFFSPCQGGRSKARRGNDKQTSLPLTSTCGGLYLSAGVIRLCRTASVIWVNTSFYGNLVWNTQNTSWVFCGTRVVSQMLWE